MTFTMTRRITMASMIAAGTLASSIAFAQTGSCSTSHGHFRFRNRRTFGRTR